MDTGALLLAVGLLVGLAAGLALGAGLARGRGERTAAERDAAWHERDRLADERPTLEARASEAEQRAAATHATLEAERAATQRRLAEVQDEQARLSEQFQALAAQALRQNNEAFLTLADQRLRASQETQAAELAKRTTEVEKLVQPIRETLGKVEASILETDKSRVASHASLMEQVKLATQTSQLLQSETRTLVQALRAPQARGAWGEMQLRRVVELAGLLEHCDFDTQVSTATADGVIRPDLVVNIAGGKHIVVDAKVSLSAFLDASQSENPDVTAARLTAHARHMREHVNALASKAYWRQFSTAPDFVVMFVPGESFLVHALSVDPGLQDHAMEQQVIIATPSTLLSLLRTVGYAWKQEALADNARTVFDLGRELYERLATLGAHVDKLGRSISAVVKDYNVAVGSLESRVLTSARKLKELKFVDQTLDEPKALDTSMVRPLVSPELMLINPLDIGGVDSAAPVATALELELSTDDRYGVDVAPRVLGSPGEDADAGSLDAANLGA